IEVAAFADQAWGEGVRALAQRIGLEGRVEGGPAAGFKRLEAALATVPPQAKPLLGAIHADWLHSYYQENRWQFSRRSSTGAEPGEDIETWDLARILAEVDQRFQAVLAEAPALQKEKAADYSHLLTAGDPLGDALRPTLYDFICHQALGFYGSEEVAVSKPQDAFEIDAAATPVFGPVEEFIAWQPQTTDTTSPKLRAVRIVQGLLAFHRGDAGRDAFLHCDLERLRWAEDAATGPELDKRRDAAFAAFIAAHGDHPLSAEARRDVAARLNEAGKFAEAHAMAKAGAEAFPEHPFGKLCRNMVMELEQRQLGLVTESHWTPAGAEIAVHHRNINRVWFRAYTRTWNPAEVVRGGHALPQSSRETVLLRTTCRRAIM
ncbi:MAG: hypothetical protein MUF04_09850, partial [Akkermansiaceae bacterium]|nr:hypothetical protein [Akkermansiaceae bacterium]